MQKSKLVAAIFSTAAIVCFAISASATDYPPQVALSTFNNTTTITTVAGNASGALATNTIEFSDYHSFQFVSVSTNAVTVGLDRSLDGANWKIVGTNSLAAGGDSGEQTMTGKWSYARYRVYGSNAVVTATYLGSR